MTVCLTCERPIPPPLEDLPTLVLGLLDRNGPTPTRALAGELKPTRALAGELKPTRALAGELKRRTAAVLAALHTLEAGGLVRREQTTLSPQLADGFRVAGSLLAALAALSASGGWTRRLTIAAALALVLVLLGSATSEGRRA